MSNVNTKMTAIADEIRTLSGTTEAIGLDAMASHIGEANNEVDSQVELLAQAVAALEGKASGGSSDPILQEKTITPTTSTQNVMADSGYDGLSQVTVNAMPTATQATPSITVSSGGLITASATQSAGYVASGTKQATKQLTTQAAKTITPSTSSQTAVAKNVYTTGAVTVGPIPPNYEDVTDETNAYTTKLASLETAVAALENELEGKASGGSGGNGNVDICTVTIDNEIYYSNWELFYSCLTDGKVELVATDLGFESKILENVIKNSYITVKIDSYDGSISSSTFSGGVSVVKTFAPSGTGYAGECMSVWQVTSDGTVAIGS